MAYQNLFTKLVQAYMRDGPEQRPDDFTEAEWEFLQFYEQFENIEPATRHLWAVYALWDHFYHQNEISKYNEFMLQNFPELLK